MRMTKFQGTPGPWNISNIYAFVIEAGNIGEKNQVATVMNDYDAHLIVAAPDLLAALQELVVAVEAYFRDDDAQYYALHTGKDKARAVIARALGQEPVRTAPDCCPACFNEEDCSSVDVCRAVEEVYKDDPRFAGFKMKDAQ
jgi:hypothetical protein